jgi:hypothetical protein
MEKQILNLLMNPILLVNSGSTKLTLETNMNKCISLFEIETKLTIQQLKIKREAERKVAVAKGLIDDPDKPRSLSEAIHFVGTCPDMCPEFEMHQREFQNNVEKWEIVGIRRKDYT